MKHVRRKNIFFYIKLSNYCHLLFKIQLKDMQLKSIGKKCFRNVLRNYLMKILFYSDLIVFKFVFLLSSYSKQ